jgi:hypothetical protein
MVTAGEINTYREGTGISLVKLITAQPKVNVGVFCPRGFYLLVYLEVVCID